MTNIVVGLFVVTYAALGIIAWRRPLLARLAFREAARRPFQSTLLVAGLMTGCAAILCMQVLIDSAIDSEVFAVEQTWGRIDLEVGASGAFFDPAVAGRLAADPATRAQITGVQPVAELVGAVYDLDRDSVRPTVQVVGFDPATQPAFGTYTLVGGRQTMGGDLTRGAVLISRSLAVALDARQGDKLQIITGDRSIEVVVAGVALPQGAGAYGLGPAVFAPLDSLTGIVPEGQVNLIRLTAGGEGQAEIERAHLAVAAVQSVLSGAAIPLHVRESKADDLKVAGSGPRTGRAFFISFGMIIVIAGTLLVVNLMLALSEERRPRLAVLRALGLSRSGHVMLSVLEGSMYSLAAGLVGIVPGLVLAGVMVNQLERALSQGRGAPDTALHFNVQAGSVISSLAAGTLITLATVALASFRGSRMSIAAAVKDLPDRRRADGRSRWLTAGIAGLGLAGLAGVATADPFLRLLGGTVLIAIALLVVAGRLGSRPRAALLGIAVTVWALIWTARGTGNGADGWAAWVTSTLLATFGLAVMITAGYRLLESLAAVGASGRLRAALRPPLAYLSRRPVPAALGVTTIAVIVAFLAVIQQAFGATAAAVQGAAGAYQLAIVAPGRSSISVPAQFQDHVAAQLAIPSRVYVGSLRTLDTANSSDITAPRMPVTLYVLRAQQIAHPVLTISGRDPRYKTDADLWRAMAADPTVVLSQTGGRTDIWLQSATGSIHYRSAGTVNSPFVSGIVGSAAALAPFSSLPDGETLLLQTAPGTNAQVLARQLQKALLDEGAEVVTREDAIARASVMANGFLSVFKLLFTIGLLVGVASLGIVALRAVIERRRTIGVLRALGYQPGAILGGVVLEALLIAASGAVVGIALGIIEGYGLASSQHLPTGLIDWPLLARTVALILGAVLAVSIAPALQAARLAPAEALRLID